MASVLMKSRMTTNRDEVYVAALPLRASKGAAQLLMSTAYSLNFWDLQHFLVIVKSCSPPSLSKAYIVYDFQPEEPENIYTALAVLSGRPVAGDVRSRKLTKLPRSKCWFIGSSNVDAINVATKFNDDWDNNLRVGGHDCRHYTNGLVEVLTGEKNVLERLRHDVSQG